MKFLSIGPVVAMALTWLSDGAVVPNLSEVKETMDHIEVEKKENHENGASDVAPRTATNGSTPYSTALATLAAPPAAPNPTQAMLPDIVMPKRPPRRRQRRGMSRSSSPISRSTPTSSSASYYSSDSPVAKTRPRKPTKRGAWSASPMMRPQGNWVAPPSGLEVAPRALSAAPNLQHLSLLMVRVHFAEVSDHLDFDLKKLELSMAPDLTNLVGMELQIASARTKRQMKKFMARSVSRRIPIYVDGRDFILRAPRPSARPPMEARALATQPTVSARSQKQLASRKPPPLFSAAQVAKCASRGPLPPPTPPPCSLWLRAKAAPLPCVRKFLAGQAPPKHRAPRPVPTYSPPPKPSKRRLQLRWRSHRGRQSRPLGERV